MDANDTHDATGTTPSPPLPTTTLTHAPFLSEPMRKAHHAFMPCDGRFAASARFLAHLWRRDHDLPAATRRPANASTKTAKRPAGWLLRKDAALAGATFLTPAIRKQAREALLFREPGSVWTEERLWGHLLSSQAMTINLLAPLAIDLDLATRVWRSLLPGFVGTVTRIRFEHSPGRFDEHWFGDGTALDALIEIVTPDGEVAVLAIEVKYVEGMTGPCATPRPRYVEAARDCGLYKDPDSPTLRRAGFEALRREHVMTSLMLRHSLSSRGAFVLIAPQLNRRAQAVAALYRTELLDPDGKNDPATVPFVNITVERVVAAMHEAGAGDLAYRLWGRYCDHERVARFALHGDDSPPTGPILPLAAAQSAPADEIAAPTGLIDEAMAPDSIRVSRRRATLERSRPSSSSPPKLPVRRRSASKGTRS